MRPVNPTPIAPSIAKNTLLFMGVSALAAGTTAAATDQTATEALPPSTGTAVTITVTDLRNSKGVVMACMTTQEDIFPRCRRDPNSHRTTVPAGETVTIRFDDVKPGKYAIALLHDENEDGKANRMLGMAPREGYGFSRDAPVQMAPPNWDDAVFTHGDEPQNLTITMRYFL